MKRLLVALAALALLPLFAPPAHAVGGGVVSILKCKPGPMLQVDPIVAPGGVKSAHLHQFFGGVAVNPPGTETTVNQMQNGETTCPLSGDTAGYWVPVLYRADGTVVKPVQVNAYYRSPQGKTVHAFPEGFGIVCPGPDCAEVDTQGGAGWGCSDQEGKATIAAALPCPSVLIAHVQLKPKDPSLPKVALHVRYPIRSGTGYRLASDMPGMAGGSSLHGDFWNTWDQDILGRLVRTLNAGKTCKGMTDSTLSCFVK